MPSKLTHIFAKSPKARVLGFSLLELMIVVAIIGILAAIAAPAYRDYVVKSRVAELVNIANPYQQQVAQAYSSGALNATGAPGSALTGCTAVASTYANQVCIGVNSSLNASIVAVQGNVTNLQLANTSQTFWVSFAGVYNATTDTLIWTCGSSSNSSSGTAKYLPGACNQTAGY